MPHIKRFDHIGITVADVDHVSGAPSHGDERASHAWRSHHGHSFYAALTHPIRLGGSGLTPPA